MKSKLVVCVCYLVLIFCFFGLYRENKTEKSWAKMRQEYSKDKVEVVVRDMNGKILAKF